MSKAILLLIVALILSGCITNNPDEIPLENEQLIIQCEIECHPYKFKWNYKLHRCACQKPKDVR